MEEVRAFEMTPGKSYRVILVPQQAALTVTVGTSDGKSHSKTIAAALLESGKQYDMSVTVTNVDISVSLSGDVSDWGDGGSLGDGGGDDTGELTYGDDSYPTAKIGGRVWMAENLRYKPAGAVEGTDMWPSQSGLSAGMLYNYATATGGVSTTGGAPVQGICPAGWHLPTAAEFESLIAAERPKVFSTTPDSGMKTVTAIVPEDICSAAIPPVRTGSGVSPTRKIRRLPSKIC